MLEKNVFDYINKHQLLAEGQLVLVALSGGADSVALLRVLLNLGFCCVAAHCNFQLRGEESDRDEQFVRSLCRELGVNCHVIAYNTYTYAHEHKQSIEMAARDLRYSYFSQLMEDLGINAVAVAHHQGDQAETVLLNLLRGSGIQGLRGMKPLNGKVVRPLLDCSKAEILQYLDELQQPFMTDSTNFIDEPLRNKIRLQIMPQLEIINPQATSAICRSAVYLAQAESLIEKSVIEELLLYKVDENVYKRSMLHLPYGGFLLYKWLSDYGFNSFQLEQIMNINSSDSVGKHFDSPSHTLWIDRQHLICVEKTASEDMPSLHTEVFSADEIALIADSTVAFLDADLLCMPLKQRFTENGDRFVPLGMNGSKLVSDFMTDNKCSPLEKQRQTVLIDGKGRIVWLVGRRIDDRFKWRKQTKKIIRITIL